MRQLSLAMEFKIQWLFTMGYMQGCYRCHRATRSMSVAAWHVCGSFVAEQNKSGMIQYRAAPKTPVRIKTGTIPVAGIRQPIAILRLQPAFLTFAASARSSTARTRTTWDGCVLSHDMMITCLNQSAAGSPAARNAGAWGSPLAFTHPEHDAGRAADTTIRLPLNDDDLVVSRLNIVVHWICLGLMPLRSLIYAAFRSKAKGLFQHNAGYFGQAMKTAVLYPNNASSAAPCDD